MYTYIIDLGLCKPNVVYIHHHILSTLKNYILNFIPHIITIELWMNIHVIVGNNTIRNTIDNKKSFGVIKEPCMC
jgi:hypothetical protein